MTSLGVHFALTAEQEDALLDAGDPDEVLDLVERIEEGAAEADLMDTDKAWDTIHRCLSDGTLNTTGGDYPLSHAVLGGMQVDAGEDYFVSYLTPEQVGDVAHALAALTEQWFWQRLVTLDLTEDLQYVWTNFVDLRRFFEQVAPTGRAVIFTVDQ